MDDASSTDPYGDGQRESPPPRPDGPPPREDEILLVDILLMLARERGLILLVTLGFAVLGGLYAVLQPNEYTATAKVVREAPAEGGGSMPSLPSSISGLGISLGGSASGLTPSSYPEILTSREVRLAVARDTFYFPETGRRTTFVQHVNRPPGVLGQVLRYTLKLPWTLKELAGSATDQRRPAGTDSTGALIFPSEEEENAIRALGNMVSASVASGSIGEEGSGLMTVSVTAGDAVLSARLNRRFIDHLRSRVREIRTKSTQQNLDFVQQRFAQVQTELEAAEDRLSQFLERNRSVLSGGRAPQLEFQRDRLQRQVTFKEQLYSQLQTRVTETQLQLQKQQPVVTIAETPAPPMEPSAPKRTLIVLLSLFLGGFVGTGIAIVLQSTQNQDGEMQEKYDEVKRSFTVRGLWRGVRDRATATKDKVD
jgi:hypothetical protein